MRHRKCCLTREMVEVKGVPVKEEIIKDIGLPHTCDNSGTGMKEADDGSEIGLSAKGTSFVQRGGGDIEAKGRGVVRVE